MLLNYIILIKIIIFVMNLVRKTHNLETSGTAFRLRKTRIIVIIIIV